MFEAAGYAAEAVEARASLPEKARAFLASRMADTAPYVPLLVEAILAAETEGLSEQAAEARQRIPRLVS